MNNKQNFKEMLYDDIKGSFIHYFLDLSSKLDIKDIWGPGHGVGYLTDYNQLKLAPDEYFHHLFS